MPLNASVAQSLLQDELLKNLCCPETKQELTPADASLIERLNKSISSGALRNRGGQTATQPIDGGLLRADGRWLYPIRNRIPIMLVDQALPV